MKTKTPGPQPIEYEASKGLSYTTQLTEEESVGYYISRSGKSDFRRDFTKKLFPKTVGTFLLGQRLEQYLVPTGIGMPRYDG